MQAYVGVSQSLASQHHDCFPFDLSDFLFENLEVNNDEFSGCGHIEAEMKLLNDAFFELANFEWKRSLLQTLGSRCDIRVNSLTIFEASIVLDEILNMFGNIWDF